MRYVIAMAVAAVCAALTTVFIASPIATQVVGGLTYDNPDTVGDLHTAVFMGVNMIGLAVGWLLGWAISGLVVKGPKPAQ